MLLIDVSDLPILPGLNRSRKEWMGRVQMIFSVEAEPETILVDGFGCWWQLEINVSVVAVGWQ